MSICRWTPGKQALVFGFKTPFDGDNVLSENHILGNVAVSRETSDEWPDELLANGCFPFHEVARKSNGHVFRIVGHDAILVRSFPHAEILIDKRSDLNAGPDCS